MRNLIAPSVKNKPKNKDENNINQQFQADEKGGKLRVSDSIWSIVYQRNFKITSSVSLFFANETARPFIDALSPFSPCPCALSRYKEKAFSYQIKNHYQPK